MISLIVKSHLKDICHERNITYRELSRQTGISHQQFSRDDINLRLENVALVLTALDCKFEDVFEIIRFDDI